MPARLKLPCIRLRKRPAKVIAYCPAVQSAYFHHRQSGPVMDDREIAVCIALAHGHADVIYRSPVARIPKYHIPRLPVRICAVCRKRLRMTPKEHDKIAAAPMVNVGVGAGQWVRFAMRANIRCYFCLQIHSCRSVGAEDYICTNADVGRRFAPAIISILVMNVSPHLSPQFRNNLLLKR